MWRKRKRVCFGPARRRRLRASVVTLAKRKFLEDKLTVRLECIGCVLKRIQVEYLYGVSDNVSVAAKSVRCVLEGVAILRDGCEYDVSVRWMSKNFRVYILFYLMQFSHEKLVSHLLQHSGHFDLLFLLGDLLRFDARGICNDRKKYAIRFRKYTCRHPK